MPRSPGPSCRPAITVTAKTPKLRIASLTNSVRPTSWTSSRSSSPWLGEWAGTVRAGPNSCAGSGIRAMLAGWTDQGVAARMAASSGPRDADDPVGAWRSQVARIVRDDEVGGSNPLAPTIPTDQPTLDQPQSVM